VESLAYAAYLHLLLGVFVTITQRVLTRKQKAMRLVLVLIGVPLVFSILMWAAGNFYTPYKITSETLQPGSKLAVNVVFVTQLELEEKNWKLDTQSMAQFIAEELQRQGLSQLQLVTARSANGQALADQKQVSREPNTVATQGDGYATMPQVISASANRQVLVFTAENINYKSRSKDLTDVTWSLNLYQNKQIVWRGVIERSSNGLLHALRDGHRLFNIMTAPDTKAELAMQNTDWAKIARLMASQMGKDGLIQPAR
jgi:hypothetical protein